MESFDLAILGAGPGGYVAAIRAAQLGLSTLLVEKTPSLGGTCLHRGCIPTKTLLEVADRLMEAREAEEFGLVLGEAPRLDMERVHRRKAAVVGRMARGLDGLMKKHRIRVETGHGALAGAGRVSVDGRLYSASKVILATGSVPAVPPGFPVDERQILTSDGMLALPGIPETLTILGAGAVGMEFASIYARYGSKVTVVELLPRVLPLEDHEVSEELERIFRRQGVSFHTATRIEEVSVGERVRVRASGPDGAALSWETEALLVAAGRRAVLEGIGLEAVGLTPERGRLTVDAFMQTQAPGIYAIGDLVASPQLAHVASAEGIQAVEHIAGLAPHPIDYGKSPSATYCHPEVASVGLTEEAARARGHELKVGRFPFAALGKASIVGETGGFVKVVAEARYQEVLGVHIVGPRATDLIAEAVLALQCEATVEELCRSIHAHPTLSEAVMEAAHAAAGSPLHFLPPPPRRAREVTR